MGLADIAGKITGKESAEGEGEYPGNEGEASFDDGPDPSPKRPEGNHRKAAPPKVSAATQKTVEKELNDILELLAVTWSVRDPYCAGALDDCRGETSKKAASIICRNPKWVAWFQLEGFSSLMQWGGLALALRPVAESIYQHHIVKTPVGEADEEAQEDFDRYVAPRIAS